MKGGAGEGAAIRRDQQVRMMEVRRYNRNLPQLYRPLHQVAGLVIKHLLVIVIKILPWVKVI